MVVASGLALALFALGLNVPEVLLVTAILNALVAAHIFRLVPEFLMRFVSWLIISLLYRLRVSGVERVPEEGPALIVCNHVSFMDALLVMGSVRRPIRFVMYYKSSRYRCSTSFSGMPRRFRSPAPRKIPR